MNVQEAQALGAQLERECNGDADPSHQTLVKIVTGILVNLARIAESLEGSDDR